MFNSGHRVISLSVLVGSSEFTGFEGNKRRSIVKHCSCIVKHLLSKDKHLTGSKIMYLTVLLVRSRVYMPHNQLEVWEKEEESLRLIN